MDENLEKSLSLVFGHEGGYVNAKTDSGGPTKYGITHRTLAAWRGVSSVSADEVKKLRLEEAAEIYRVGYWAQCGGSVLPSGVDYAVFDFGVNSGPARAVRYLQKVLGVEMDGSIGPVTLAAVRAYPGGAKGLIYDYCAARMKFLRGLSSRKTGFPVNGRGWTIRVTGIDPKGEWAAPARASSGTRPQWPKARASGRRRWRFAKRCRARPRPRRRKRVPGRSPETLVQALPGLGGLGLFSAGEGPMQYALGAALLIFAGSRPTWWCAGRARPSDAGALETGRDGGVRGAGPRRGAVRRRVVGAGP